MFAGWYDNPEFTGDIVTYQKIAKTILLMLSGQMMYRLDHWLGFRTVAKTGYAAGDLTWTNNSTEATANKDRTQINTSNYAPHNDGHFLVLSIRDTASEAWMS